MVFAAISEVIQREDGRARMVDPHCSQPPGEPGSETWPKGRQLEDWRCPDLADWSYDADTDHALLKAGGNPGSWQSDQHPGDNLWTDPMLALDPNTGKDQMGIPVHAE